MFKKISWIVALIAAFAMVFMGCPEDEKYKGNTFTFELDEAAIVLTPWGDNPEVDAQGFVNITTTAEQAADKGNTSTGFSIDLKTLVKDYVYNKNAKIVFTYEIDVEEAEACLTVKNANGGPGAWKDATGDAAYGVGKGMEYYLGSLLTGGVDLKASETASNYEGTMTVGTYDTVTKTGTFEVYLRTLQGLNVIGFQHNAWAQFPSEGTFVARGSKYKVKFTNIKSVLVRAVELPPEPDAYIISHLNTSFDWTTVGVTNTVVNLGAPQITDPKPRWEITTETTPVAYSAFTVAGKVPKNILIVLGDITESKVTYWQVATQYFDADDMDGGGKGWANHEVLSGGSPFPEISTDGEAAGTTWDGTKKLITITVLPAFASYLGDDVTDVTVGGFVLFFNAGGEENIDIVAIGIEYEDE